MKRRNEYPTHNAGARFIQSLRKLGFGNNCLVFTRDQKKSEAIIQSELNSEEQKFVFVITGITELRNFIEFQPNLRQSKFKSSSELGTETIF